jgi:hypothetical protein
LRNDTLPIRNFHFCLALTWLCQLNRAFEWKKLDRNRGERETCQRFGEGKFIQRAESNEAVERGAARRHEQELR